MKSLTTPDFWQSYSQLSSQTKKKARKAYRLWKADPRHPSLRFKKVGELWAVRIDASYRALGVVEEDVLYWFWIGAHAEYERLITQSR